jgi:dienelactone hydrolase
LARLQPAVPAAERGGAVAAWAWGYSRVLEALEQEPGVDPARTAVWGHSRNGKAALLAAAFDPRIDLVIAHQSGRGGAALSRSARGESVAEITAAFPHWFARASPVTPAARPRCRSTSTS